MEEAKQRKGDSKQPLHKKKKRTFDMKDLLDQREYKSESTVTVDVPAPINPYDYENSDTLLFKQANPDNTSSSSIRDIRAPPSYRPPKKRKKPDNNGAVTFTNPKKS